MRVLTGTLAALLLCSTNALAQDDQDESSESLQESESSDDEPQKIGVLVLPANKKLRAVAMDLEELLAMSFSDKTPFAVLDGEQLRKIVAPEQPFKKQSKAVEQCLKDPGCIAPLMVQEDMIFWTVSYVGKSGKGLRLRLNLFDLDGNVIATHDSGRVTQEQLYEGTFLTAEKLIGKHRGTLIVKTPSDAHVIINDDKHPSGEHTLSFLEPGPYKIVVSSKGKRPFEQTVELRASALETVEVKATDLKPWVSKAVAQKRDQGIAYFRKDLFEMAASTLAEARALPGGDQDSKLLFYLARSYVDLNELAKAFESAEAATKTHDPEGKFGKRAAELLKNLRKSYGSVIFKRLASSTVKQGYIYLDDIAGLIGKEKKEQFRKLRNRLKSQAVDLSTSGYVYFLPYGQYRANGVPFTVEQGSLPEVEILLEATPREQESKGLSVPVMVASGAGAALLTAFGMHLMAVSEAEDYETAGNQKKAFEARDCAEFYQKTAFVGYGLAAVAGGVAGWLWWQDQSRSVVALPGQLILQGSF